MASSARCPTEIHEKINYTKLCILLVDRGTQAVRSVFNGIHPPSTLKAVLKAEENKTTLQKLRKPRGRVLNNEQWNKLYPPSGSDPKSEEFDITLLFVLLRNICGLTPPATGWDALPPGTDTSKEADLARIKYYRNEIAHRPNNEISDADFEQLWQDISSALVSLGLSKDDIDDFRVRVKEGEEALASQCNDVLSDIRNGKKDLDKPLNLTDSEKYALEFLVCLSVRKDSSAIELADKFGFFSNAYILTVLTFETGLKKESSDTESVIPSFIHKMLGNVRRFRVPLHWPSCPLRRPCSFGSCLAWLLQAAHEEGVRTKLLTPEPLSPKEALKKHRLPYYDKKSLLPTSDESPSFRRCLLKRSKDGFIAVFLMDYRHSPRNAVYRFQLDGSLIGKEFFNEKMLIATSPNINFIVAFKPYWRKIDILDATTLEVVSQYDFPHDAIQTCHMFEDDQGFFIVIKGRHDNKVYVFEGLTGRVRNTITVAEGSEVMDVSCQGHIVVSRTWRSDKPEERITFTNKDGELVELMNWKSRNGQTCRELFLYHHDRGQERIPIHPLAGKICQCLEFKHRGTDAVHFSEDGRLLVYQYKDSFFIVHTSDGSLFKRCRKRGLSAETISIVFVSRLYLVILDKYIMFVINVQTNEIEHRISLSFLEISKEFSHDKCLLFPQEDGKSFDLISCGILDSETKDLEISRLVFHNLNLQGLQ